MCEDFAPRNGAARVRRERGANRASKKPVGPEWRRGSKLKGSGFRRCAESTPFISYFFSSSGFFSVGSVFKFRSKSVC